MQQKINKCNGKTITPKEFNNLLIKAVEYTLQAKKKDILTKEFNEKLNELKTLLKLKSSIIITYVEETRTQQCELRISRTDL